MLTRVRVLTSIRREEWQRAAGGVEKVATHFELDEPRYAKVGELGDARPPIPQDILGLDVAVAHAREVEMLEAEGEAAKPHAQLGLRHRPLARDALREVAAAHELHDHKEQVLIRVVDYLL